MIQSFDSVFFDNYLGMKSSIPVNIVSTIANWESRPKYILIIFQTEQYKIQINKIKNSFFKRKPKIFKQKKQRFLGK